jgi:hypothetical protein
MKWGLPVGAWLRKSNPSSHTVEIGCLADASELAYSGDSHGKPRALVPFEHVVSPEAFAPRGGWHHFVSAMVHGGDVLTWFYEAYSPANAFEIVGIEAPAPPPGDPHGQGSWPNVPWAFRYRPGRPYANPTARPREDLAKLMALESSICKDGYNPDRYGDVLGQFLVRGQEYRFLVITGKHRAAVLAAMGHAALPARLKPGRPGMVSRENVGSWPLVARGLMTRSDALRIFDSYFDQNGYQQFEALLRAKPGEAKWRNTGRPA